MTQLSIAEETQLYGQYYLGHLYNLEDFLSMDTVTVFPASEMINEQSVNNERYSLNCRYSFSCIYSAYC